MNSVCTIFQREFFGYFRSPVAYVFLIVFLTATTMLPWFVGNFFETNDASLASFFTFLPWIFLFLIPAAGMRLWSEEKRSGTWELLFTLPISVGQAVFGKFLAAWAFICLAMLLTFPMALTVGYLGKPDWGPIAIGYVGAMLTAGAYMAVCSLMSSLTKNQVISFVLSVMVCLVLLVLGWSVFSGLLVNLGLPVSAADAVANFSFYPHFDSFSKGLILVKSVAFFASVTGVSLFLNILVLER
jgi:ABC-2 type transport system permease protein